MQSLQTERERILAQITAQRQHSSDTPRENYNSRPREVYKKENNKKSNYSSREMCEEVIITKVSDETCPLACQPVAIATSSSSLEGEDQGQEARGNAISPASTSSRTLSGISAHHNKSGKGIKISITLQKTDEAHTGALIQLTAELKRADRLRELRAYDADSSFFANFYDLLKQTIREDPDRKRMAVGRLHERSRRDAWVADMCVVAELDGEVAQRVVFYYQDETYEITMDHQQTTNQERSYHSTGITGRLHSNKRAPTLDTLRRTSF
jgi:hypothetical protein